MALVRSANDGDDDVALYNQRAHGFIPKEPVSKVKVAEAVAPLWAKRFAENNVEGELPSERRKGGVSLSKSWRFSAQNVSTDPIALVENAQIPIIESNKHMVITHCNAATTSVFGYTPKELVGQRVNVLMTPQESLQHDGYIHNFERTGVKKILATVGRTVIGRHKNGTQLTLQLTTTSTATGYAAVFVNMTFQVETERRALAVERAKAEAERSMKEFLVRMR